MLGLPFKEMMAERDFSNEPTVEESSSSLQLSLLGNLLFDELNIQTQNRCTTPRIQVYAVPRQVSAKDSTERLRLLP